MPCSYFCVSFCLTLFSKYDLLCYIIVIICVLLCHFVFGPVLFFSYCVVLCTSLHHIIVMCMLCKLSYVCCRVYVVYVIVCTLCYVVCTLCMLCVCTFCMHKACKTSTLLAKLFCLYKSLLLLVTICNFYY